MAKMKSIPFLLKKMTILLQIHFFNIYSKAKISKVLDKQELNVRDFLSHSLKAPLPCNRAFLGGSRILSNSGERAQQIIFVRSFFYFVYSLR